MELKLKAIKAPKGKVIVVIEKTADDDLVYDIRKTTTGTVVDGEGFNEGDFLVFGEHFATIDTLTTDGLRYLVMQVENVRAILELEND